MTVKSASSTEQILCDRNKSHLNFGAKTSKRFSSLNKPFRVREEDSVVWCRQEQYEFLENRYVHPIDHPNPQNANERYFHWSPELSRCTIFQLDLDHKFGLRSLFSVPTESNREQPTDKREHFPRGEAQTTFVFPRSQTVWVWWYRRVWTIRRWRPLRRSNRKFSDLLWTSFSSGRNT